MTEDEKAIAERILEAFNVQYRATLKRLPQPKYATANHEAAFAVYKEALSVAAENWQRGKIDSCPVCAIMAELAIKAGRL